MPKKVFWICTKAYDPLPWQAAKRGLLPTPSPSTLGMALITLGTP